MGKRTDSEIYLRAAEIVASREGPAWAFACWAIRWAEKGRCDDFESSRRVQRFVDTFKPEDAYADDPWANQAGLDLTEENERRAVVHAQRLQMLLFMAEIAKEPQ